MNSKEEKKNFSWTGKQSRSKGIMNNPDTSSIDYKYGIYAHIGQTRKNSGSRYWTDEQIMLWCDKRDIYYSDSDARVDLVNRIKQAGYK